MSFSDQEAIQLLNTAIIKTKEKEIDSSYEDRLNKACNAAAIEAINVATTHLAETKNISRDQAAMQLVETIRELDAIWNDYVMMEGISKLKDVLRQ